MNPSPCDFTSKPLCSCELLTDDLVVLAQHLQPLAVAEDLGALGRPLDVGEQTGDGSVGRHGPGQVGAGSLDVPRDARSISSSSRKPSMAGPCSNSSNSNTRRTSIWPYSPRGVRGPHGPSHGLVPGGDLDEPVPGDQVLVVEGTLDHLAGPVESAAAPATPSMWDGSPSRRSGRRPRRSPDGTRAARRSASPSASRPTPTPARRGRGSCIASVATLRGPQGSVSRSMSQASSRRTCGATTLRHSFAQGRSADHGSTFFDASDRRSGCGVLGLRTTSDAAEVFVERARDL